MTGMSDGKGVWMAAPDGRVYRINYQDTLTRLLADGWTIQDADAVPIPASVSEAADVAENGATSEKASEDAPAPPTATPRPAQSVTQHVRRQAALNAANAPVVRPTVVRRKRG